MRFLILGANGLLGKQLQKDCTAKGYVYFAATRKGGEWPNVKCDILAPGDLEKAFEVAKPDVVINATNLAGGVDYCESHPDQCKQFHYIANVNIGNLCKLYSVRMVLVSTDYVFDGSNPPYNEDDEVNPLNIYGHSKLQAEKWMADNLPRYTITRTTNVFGWDPETNTPNYLMGLYFKLKDGANANAPSFLWGNPTHVSQLSATIIELCEKNENGIFHVVGSSFINRYEWAQMFCQVTGLNAALLTEIKEPAKGMIPRPLKSNLSTHKVRKVCSTPVEDVATGLEKFVAEMGPAH